MHYADYTLGRAFGSAVFRRPNSTGRQLTSLNSYASRSNTERTLLPLVVRLGCLGGRGVLHVVHRRQGTSSYQVIMIACSAAAASIQARLSALAGREG